jgi:DNA polymerase-3 subunit chi
MEVRFYHLTAAPLERVLPQLLERTLQRGWRAVVRVGSEERAEALASHLWTYSKESFLPHGTRRDGFAEDQPIWITERDERPNAAEVLFIADGAALFPEPGFRLACDLFDGNDRDSLTAARERWRRCREAGHALVYYQQDEAGTWTERQRAGGGGAAS